MIALVALIGAARADEPGPLHEGNVAATTVGAQFWQSGAMQGLAKSSNADLLFGQRLRWTLTESDSLAVRLRADGRFTYGPGDVPTWERNRVRQLGVSFVGKKLTVDVGRHQVHKGGPRLVDGLQAVFRTEGGVELGAWGGLIPDFFTSEPRVRPGGGPILSFAGSRVQTSLVGEFSGDRSAVLAMARASAARTIEISGRLDLGLTSPDGGPHLSDGQVFVRWAPVPSTRIDVFWNAFSSYRYQDTEALDPDVKRFADRYLSDNPFLLPALQNCLEPKVAQQVGSTFSVRPQGDKVSPVFSLAGRGRFGPNDDLPPLGSVPACQLDDINSYVRVSPRIGLQRIPLGGALEVAVDANYFVIEGRTQVDAGISAYWEPSDDGSFAIDTSYRLISNPYDPKLNPLGYDGLGSYADLFVDLVIDSADLVVGAGLNLESEPGYVTPQAQLTDVGIGAFGRITKYLRPRKKKD